MVAPQALDETASPQLIGRIRMQKGPAQQSCTPSQSTPLLMTTKQLWMLHTALVK